MFISIIYNSNLIIKLFFLSNVGIRISPYMINFQNIRLVAAQPYFERVFTIHEKYLLVF